MIHLLRTEIKGLKLFKEERLLIDFVAEKNVTEEDLNNGAVQKLDDSISKLNVLAMVGSNATGKTTQLKLLNMVLDVFLSLNSLKKHKELMPQFNERVNLTNYFYQNKILYKVDSYLEKDSEGNLFFDEEIISSKKVFPSHKKADLFVIDTEKRSQKEELRRSKLNAETRMFLRDDYSVFSTIVNKLEKNKKTNYVLDEIEMTNSNELNSNKEFPVEFIKYFDPSIESLEIITEEILGKKVNVELKFKDGASYQVPLIELSNYLSSGTIKGINLFMDIEKMLVSGGYLLIDEIENHLHKSIVMNVIHLFSTTLNKNGATLIFSTHYSEITDILQRTDMIYIATKENDKISVEKMSTLLGTEDRNDKKKSEVLLSGKLDSTPTYKDLKNVRKRIRSKVYQEDLGADSEGNLRRASGEVR